MICSASKAAQSSSHGARLAVSAMPAPRIIFEPCNAVGQRASHYPYALISEYLYPSNKYYFKIA
jgi:hypothetical protein